MRKVNTTVAFILLMFTFTPAASAENEGQKLRVLCWHSVGEKAAENDSYTVTRRMFVEQLEYLTSHGFQPVSVEQVIRAVKGESRLPEKAILLSFDDAYRSFYDFVFPVLSRFGYPSMLAVVGSWIEKGPPDGLPEPLMTWRQIADVARDGLVEVASHSYDLHRSKRYNRVGNVGSIVSVREFLPGKNAYESESEYQKKLVKDFSKQTELFVQRLGKSPRVIIWPYGRYNDVSIFAARESGSLLAYNLAGGFARLDRPYRLNRILVQNSAIRDFIRQVEDPEAPHPPIRAVQVDLDLIYDPVSYEQTDRNLGLLIERLLALGVNTVFLQAFHDASGRGDIESVYFQNRVLPCKADIFSHAVHQMIIRGIQVYAWMPTLGVVFPDEKFNGNNRVMEYVGGKLRPSSSWRRRLTPFSPEVRANLRKLYEDLAAGSQINGVLFQDDAYLTDREDFHPLALKAFREKLEQPFALEQLKKDPEIKERWTSFKAQALIDLTEELNAGVRKYRPHAGFARNLFANVLLNPVSREWFAQDYEDFIKTYDYVVVMAYANMEKAHDPVSWIKRLAIKASVFPKYRKKTIFKLQAFDWKKETWIEDRRLLKQMRTALASGVRHIAYYPDNFWIDRPQLDVIKLEMSTRNKPRVKQ